MYIYIILVKVRVYNVNLEVNVGVCIFYLHESCVSIPSKARRLSSPRLFTIPEVGIMELSSITEGLRPHRSPLQHPNQGCNGDMWFL